jgi:lysophospholipase L1-like esterase
MNLPPLLLLLGSLSVAAPVKEDPAVAAPRVVEYPWMSVAGWNARAAELAAQAKKGGVDVLFFGDSITERWATSGAEVWARAYAPRKAANFGIGGDTTQNLLWRLENGGLDGLSPRVVVLLIGTNNLGLRGDSPEDAARGAAAVVAALRKRFPEAKILLLGLLPRGEKADDPGRPGITAVNARLAKLDDGKEVRSLDFGAKLLEPDGTLTKDMAPDSLHIGPRGYAIWAEAMEPLLTKLLGPSS